jgi:hypothetical protein
MLRTKMWQLLAQATNTLDRERAHQARFAVSVQRRLRASIRYEPDDAPEKAVQVAASRISSQWKRVTDGRQ